MIKNGHKYSDVLWEYTMDEIAIFYGACQRLASQEIVRDAMAVRVGNNADKQQFGQFVDNMTKAVDETRSDKIESIKNNLQKLKEHRIKRDGRVPRIPKPPMRD